jgi:hypothetical protein
MISDDREKPEGKFCFKWLCNLVLNHGFVEL